MKIILSTLIFLLFSNLTNAQTTTIIPDANFEQELINLGLDNTIDGVVLTANIDTLTHLDVGFNSINDLTGIADFNALTYLNCEANQLTSLNITQNQALNNLNCRTNQLTNIDITQNTALTELRCSYNSLNNLDISQNLSLTTIFCTHNMLTNLNTNLNSALTLLACHDNLITNLDLSLNTLLTEFSCNNNQLTSLNVSHNLNLISLACNDNFLSKLNVAQNSALISFVCRNNQLNCLNVKNGNNNNFTNFRSEINPNLNCIEVDNVVYSNTNWTNIDAASSFSTSCSNPCTVGIKEFSLSKTLLSPNPTLNQLTINSDLEILEIKIIDITGKVIMITKENTNAINVTDLLDGIYFIQLITEKRTITQKFIKQ